MNKLASTVVLSLLLLMSGCSGGNNSDKSPVVITEDGSNEGNTNNENNESGDIVNAEIEIVLPITSSTVSSNKEVLTIDVRVFDGLTHYTEGNVTVLYPDEAVTGRDTGYFASSVVSVNGSGKSSFTYVAPDNLGNNTSDIVFGFYHSNNRSDIKEYTVKIDALQDESNSEGEIIMVTDAFSTISTNSEVIEVNIKVIDSELFSPYDTGFVTAVYPEDIKLRDVGVFTERIASVDNGVASFTYTGPGDIENNSSDIVFGFYHSDTPTDIKYHTIIIDSVELEQSLSVGKVILTQSATTVKTNSETLDINVTVIDSATRSPYDTGSVTIVFPEDIEQSRDVGRFDAATKFVDNGIASFAYTAPVNLEANTSNIVFGFYHDSNVEDIKYYTVSIAAAQEDLNSSKTYNLDMRDADENYSMSLESLKQLTFIITDNEDGILEDEDIESISVELLNPSLADVNDGFGNSGDFLTINNKNPAAVNLVTNKVSGVIPLKVEARFNGFDGELNVITEVFNIVIYSGPPSAISLSYVETSLERQDVAKFVEKWAITITDKYNNLVNTNPTVSMGMLVGYAKASAPVANSTDFLYFPPSTGNGELDLQAQIFTATSDIFANVDDTNDYLVTFGDGYTYNASGKWEITTVGANARVLDLIEGVEGNITSGLGYAVGNNYRQHRTYEGDESTGIVYPEDEGNFVIPSTGSMRISVEYDYYLVGKDVMLWANLVGKHYEDDSTVRIGEANKVTLRGSGVEPVVSTLVVEVGATEKIYRFSMKISETVEWYEHANFAAIFEPTDFVVINSIEYSGTNETVAFVDVNVTNLDGQAGSIEMVSSLVTNEF